MNQADLVQVLDSSVMRRQRTVTSMMSVKGGALKGRDVHRCLDGVQGRTANGAVSGAVGRSSR